METNEIHQGKKIEELLESSDMSIVKFASKLGVSRTYVYKLFKQESIKPILFEKILVILGQSLSINEESKNVIISTQKLKADDRYQLIKEIEYLKQRARDLEALVESKNVLIKALSNSKKKE